MKTEKTKEALTRGVEQVLPDRQGLFKLMQRRKIKVYHGMDPTSSKLHIGHIVSLRKLQEFAELGHEATLVVGTGTVLTGDPSLRDEGRAEISSKQIKENIKTWKAQAGKVLDFSKVKIKYNGGWLLKLKYEDIIDIASHISAVKLFQREMFQRRIKQGDTVWSHETLYPLMQGYDSVFLDVDLEIGGTDQVFNMLIGRELQQKMRGREKFVMTMPMILGTDGKKMSKSSGNCVWLADSADQMYGKIMSMPDGLIESYFKALTDVPLSRIKKLPPRDAKAKLAEKIVSALHNKTAARRAGQEFNRIFREKKTPSKIPTVSLKQKNLSPIDLLIRTKMAPSRSEAKRLILQGGVKISGKKQSSWQEKIKLKKGDVVQVGKRKFVKIA